MKRYLVTVLLILIGSLFVTACTPTSYPSGGEKSNSESTFGAQSTNQVSTGLEGKQGQGGGSSLTPMEFLNLYQLTVDVTSQKFAMTVPDSWKVTLGAYPEGLFWGLANEFSKDAQLDLAKLKGQKVEAWIYPLREGLPGQGDNSQFSYPSNVVLLVQEGKVVGAWLAFNTTGIGPSVKKRSLQEVTGLSYEQWIAREGFFSDSGKNQDLEKLGPKEVLEAFFAAIQSGDKTRAYACLSPRNLRSSLTVNLEPKKLYHPDFNTNNSMVDNILEAKPISYRYLDPEDPGKELKEISNNATKAEIAVTLVVKWRNEEFNTPTGKTMRFAVLRKYDNGWKIEGLGTGP